MLRRRRSSLALLPAVDDPLAEGKKKKQDFPLLRANKLKMSPFPEVVGRIEPGLSWGDKGLDGVKMALQFAEEPLSLDERGHASLSVHSGHDSSSDQGGDAPSSDRSGHTSSSDHSGYTILPSHVVEMQKSLATRQQPQGQCHLDELLAGGEESNKPSASIKTMWDSVVNWMKTAVDYIASDEPPEAEPISSPRARKRPLRDANSTSPPSHLKVPRLSSSSSSSSVRGGVARKVVTGGRGKRGGRRASLGGFGARRDPRGRMIELSGAGLGQLLSLEPIAEFPPTPRRSDSAVPPPDQTLPTIITSPTSLLARDLSHSLSVRSPSSSKPRSTGPAPCSGDDRPIRSRSCHRSGLERASDGVSGAAGESASLLEATGGKICSAASLMRFHSANHGLNSILDGSPLEGRARGNRGRGIRRPALRQFYGNSLASPNLSGVDDALCGQATNNPTARGIIPAPPPLPPLPPSTPHPPPLPPVIPGTPLPLSGGSVEGEGGAADPSRILLLNMQSRLRGRMRRGVAGEVVGGEKGGCEKDTRSLLEKLDMKTRQWAEIQAHSRRVSLEAFLRLAEQSREELKLALQSLSSAVPQSMEEVEKLVDRVQEASQWFPGGNKEMREVLPLYKALEKKIETLNEYIQICGEMGAVSLLAGEPEGGTHYSALHTKLKLIREEFRAKHSHWKTILLSGAESWRSIGLPVDLGLLGRARNHLCALVRRFVHLSLDEAAKISGVLVSIKCVRTGQVKERLRESLDLVLEAFPYLPTEAPPTGNYEATPTSEAACGEGRPTLGYPMSLEGFLSLSVSVAMSYVRISLEQFLGFVNLDKRQAVCSHFEGVLKILSLLKLLVTKLPKDSGDKRNGILHRLPSPEALSSVVYSSCVQLIRHIASRAQAQVSPSKAVEAGSKSKEMVLWMMFGCKYVHQTLEVLGQAGAGELGVQALLQQLQQMENLLPE